MVLDREIENMLGYHFQFGVVKAANQTADFLTEGGGGIDQNIEAITIQRGAGQGAQNLVDGFAIAVGAVNFHRSFEDLAVHRKVPEVVLVLFDGLVVTMRQGDDTVLQ